MASVLVIDDESGVRALLRHGLEQAGHQVDEAADGVAGLRACRSKAYDVVICDIVMPQQEGLATIRELRKEFPSLRVLAISGGMPSLPELDVLKLAEMIGAWRALAKPFAMAQLLALVEEATRVPATEG